MFEVELFGLLNRYKKSADNEEQNKLKLSIEELIRECPKELKVFLKSQEIDDQTKQFLESCQTNKVLEGKEKELQMQKEQPLIEQEFKDVQIILNYYKNWLNSYQANSNQINDECSNVIKNILNFYIVNNFVVLQQILDMNDTQDFEKFKNHLKNNIRAYYGQKIAEYLEGGYKELGFFAKFRKKRQIKDLLNKIGNYNFNTTEIAEVLK